MADNGYDMIKPVESLQTVGGLTPAKRRGERKRRRNSNRENEEKPERGDELLDDQQARSESGEHDNDEHSIDYCA
jgi:protein involved in polysaccharide export with SLBB domain